MNSGDASIQIFHHPGVEASEVADLREVLLQVSGNVTVQEQKLDPMGYMSVDWAMPASVIVPIGAPVVAGFLGMLGGKAAEKSLKAFGKVYQRFRSRRFWKRGEKVIDAPVMSFVLDSALPAQQAGIRFLFPPEMTDLRFRAGLSQMPGVVREERRINTPYGTSLGMVDRKVTFSYQPESRKWKRVWPERTDEDILRLLGYEPQH